MDEHHFLEARVVVSKCGADCSHEVLPLVLEPVEEAVVERFQAGYRHLAGVSRVGPTPG